MEKKNKGGRPKYKMPPLDKFREMAIKKAANVAEMAKGFGVSRGTVYNWINESAELKSIMDDERESLLDLCESQRNILIKGVPRIENDEKTGEPKFTGWLERPSETLIIFTLKTLGKARGYIERQEVDARVDGVVELPAINLITKTKKK